VSQSGQNMLSTDLPRLMTIFAHPDDETFGVAGTMARATAAGHPVAIVSATRGEAGEIARPDLATKENLGVVREGELRAAAAAVGVHDVTFLGYGDGRVPEADVQEAVGRIVRELRRFRPEVIVTFAANGGYGHVDHMAIHRLALAAVEAAFNPQAYPEQIAAGLAPHRVRKVYFNAIPRRRLLAMVEEARKEGRDFIPGGDAATLPLEEMGAPDETITTRVALTRQEFERKLAAVQAHVTQLPEENPWTRATPDQLFEFMGAETFVLAPPPLSDRVYPTPEEDLFAGL
jgi:LmbE family N-acetylglucosaminyl deacetylase